MFVFRPLLATALAAAYVRLASAFQPGSDYNASHTTDLYNCTGLTPVSKVTGRNAADTLPQIDPSSDAGWEQWTLSVHGTIQFVVRWNRGDPSLSSGTVTPRFDIFANIDGSIGQSTFEGDFSYSASGPVKRIAIGDNVLMWDENALWFNASVNIDDYQIQVNSYSATLDSFHPNAASYNGLLDESGAWFGSAPVIRGQVSGSVITPRRGSVTLGGLSALRHMFSENPLPSYITNYTTANIWGDSVSFYDSHTFYRTATIDGTVHQAAYLGRALPSPATEGALSSAWATYGVTDDRLYALSIDPTTNAINALFRGCADTDEVPYVFNVTALEPLGLWPDVGGGITTYYTISDGATSAAFEGAVRDGAVVGFVEVYQAPEL